MKKANLQSQFFIVLVIFGTIVAGLFAVRILSAFNSKIQSKDSVPDVAKQSIDVYNTRLPKWVDGALIFFFVLFQIVSLFLALQIPTNPILLPLSFIMYAFSTIVSYFLSIIYNRISTSAELLAAGSQLTAGQYLMSNLHILSLVFGVIIISLMVIKR